MLFVFFFFTSFFLSFFVVLSSFWLCCLTAKFFCHFSLVHQVSLKSTFFFFLIFCKKGGAEFMLRYPLNGSRNIYQDCSIECSAIVLLAKCYFESAGLGVYLNLACFTLLSYCHIWHGVGSSITLFSLLYFVSTGIYSTHHNSIQICQWLFFSHYKLN